MLPLSVRDLAVTRGDRRIFQSVQFDVTAGEVLHVRGRNGAGKTTLMEVLCGLRAASEGQVTGSPGPDARHWLGHRSGLNPALSPLENLRFWCTLSGCKDDGARPALARLGLERVGHRPCGALSTGQRRRAALARLVAVERSWWFLDEPLAGLDASAIALVAELIDTHCSTGGSVVLTSHQPVPLHSAAARILELSTP